MKGKLHKMVVRPVALYGLELDIEEKKGGRVGGAGAEDVEVLRSNEDGIENESIRTTLSDFLEIKPERTDFGYVREAEGGTAGKIERKIKVIYGWRKRRHDISWSKGRRVQKSSDP